MAAHNDLGKAGEALAAEFLEASGYTILDRNYRFLKAEVDLIALNFEHPELVFVEVKTRTYTGPSAVLPEESVSQAKQNLIFRAADAYIYEKQMRTVPIRFDIIAVQMHPEHPLIHHIPDAFRMVNGTSWS